MYLMQSQAVLVSEVFFANVTIQQGLKILMGHPNVVLQSIRVFKSCSTIIALKLGVVMLPAVLQKGFLVLEQKRTLVALKPDSFVFDGFVAI